MFAQVLWNSPRSLPVAVVVALVTLVAVVWLYPPQVKGLSWGWRWGLPALRAAGMLVLAAALLKPALLRPKTADEQGTVVVLVDRSRSMAVVDNARSPAQLVALADGLGMLAAGVRSEAGAAVAARAAELRPLVAAAERAWGDLEYARVAGRGVEAARDRASRAAERLRVGIDALRGAAGGPGDPALRERVGALGEAPTPDEPKAGAALAALRAKLDAVAAAAGQVQAGADEQLYRSNESVRAVCDALARRSRFELASEALLRPAAGLLDRLGGEVPVVGFGAAADLTPMPLGRPGNSKANSEAATRPVDTAPAAPGAVATGTVWAEPDGRRSDLAGCVRQAVELFDNRDLAAVVLLSDGRQTGGGGALTSGVAASDAPVFVVAAAPQGAVRDVSLGTVRAPTSAFVGESVTVRADVRPLGTTGGEAKVTLAPGGGAEQAQVVKFSEGRPTAAEFQLKLERPGAQLLTVTVAPGEGEATAENNAARRWVKVLSQKVRVGAFAALPGWDFQYLRNALARTAWVELEAGVLNPGAPRLPLTPEQILRLDVLVLADVPVAALDDAQWGAVYRLVSERGGSVVLLAGTGHVPAEYGANLVASSLLPYPAELTPTWRMWPGEEPAFRLVPHPDATADPALRLGGEGEAAGLQRWQMLPGMYRVLPVGRLKPSAAALLVEASSGEPVVTQNRVGSGRTFLVGANETWRWRAGGGEETHDRFWLQLVRHAAGEPYAVVSERLGLDVEKVALDAGEVVRAKVRDFAGVGAQGLKLEVVRTGQPGGQPARVVALNLAGEGESGRLAGDVGPLPAGEYELRLSETNAAAPGIALTLVVTAGYEAELADVSPDEAGLARVAEATGGEVFRLEDVGRLAERLRATAGRRSRYVERRLWDSPYLFVLVVACFAAEWAARKRLGLA